MSNLSSNLNFGHRERLRQKILSGGGIGMHDYELLEILLFGAIPRKDVKQLAKNLLKHCSNDMSHVINATPDHLRQVNGMGDTSIALLICVRIILERMLGTRIRDGSILNNWAALLDYLRATTKGSTREHLRVIYMDKKYKVIDEEFDHGTVDRVAIYEREIIRHALYKGATSIVISHNHISNDATPSQSDIVVTKKLIASCNVVGLQVVDHIIIAGDNYFSFKERGLI